MKRALPIVILIVIVAVTVLLMFLGLSSGRSSGTGGRKFHPAQPMRLRLIFRVSAKHFWKRHRGRFRP